MKRASGIAVLALLAAACGDSRLYDERRMATGYRSGTVDDGYLSNGERGNVEITEINWAGSVETVEDGFVHHPYDVFIELRNKHARPIHLTGWQIIVEVADGSIGGDEALVAHYVIPPRDSGEAVDVNEYVVIATSRDRAYPEADYVIPNLQLPRDRFEITLRDLDGRLIEGAGNAHEDVPGGAWDLVTARSMERVQLIFSNDGGRNSSWHSYSLNAWDDPLHTELRDQLHPDFAARTYATPGRPNTPDYSGNTSSGSFE